MIDCLRFETLLEGWVAGTLEAEDRRAAEAHLAGCPDCRGLWKLARLPDDAPDLVATVVAATVGSSCPRAEELLPAYLEADLPDADHRLVALHLETCAACRGLAQVLTALDAALPRLAELPVPAAFTHEVLAASRSLGSRVSGPLLRPAEPLAVRLSRRWRVTWSRLIQRPRFATEIAYALTVAGVLAVKVTGSFAGAEPRDLFGRVRAETLEQVQALVETPVVSRTAVSVRRLGDRFGDVVEALGRTAGTFLEQAASSLQKPDEPESSAATKETP